MTKGREGSSDRAESRVAAIRAAEHAGAPRRSQGAGPKSRLSSECAPGKQDRRGPRRGGPTDTGVAGCEGLGSVPHSQRRTSVYSTNTADTAMADPSVANK